MTVVCDLDGVVWLAAQPIPGAAAAVAALRRAGHRVLFVTNNSFATVAEVEAKLAGVGVPAEGDVITSAVVAGDLVAAGERVLVCGGPGIEEAVRRRGAEVVRPAGPAVPVDVVVVGFHRSFDYEVMRVAATAVRAGARLVGTNTDATYPTPEGPIPGGGAILAAVATAAGRDPVVAGKPHEPMAAAVRAATGGEVGDAVMVGDRPETDGAFARTIGCRFALVLSGVTGAGDLPVEPEPDLVAADLAGVAAWLGAY